MTSRDFLTRQGSRSVEIPSSGDLESLASEFCSAPDPELLLLLLRRAIAERPTPVFVSVSEVCRSYSISRSTFDRELSDPESGLKPLLTRIRGRWRVPLTEFDAWFRERRES